MNKLKIRIVREIRIVILSTELNSSRNGLIFVWLFHSCISPPDRIRSHGCKFKGKNVLFELRFSWGTTLTCLAVIKLSLLFSDFCYNNNPFLDGFFSKIHPARYCPQMVIIKITEFPLSTGWPDVMNVWANELLF